MKRWMKWLLVIVLVVVVGILILFASIDRLAKSAIEYGGTYALGVPTTLDKASIGVFSGKFGLSRLQIANPQGFKSESFLKLETGATSLSIGSLLKDKIEVQQLTLSDMELNLERDKGSTNYAKILDNLARFESSEKKEGGKGFVVREIAIRNVAVRVGLVPVVGDMTSFTVKIPEIILKDVGSDSKTGVLIADLTGIVLKAVLTSAIEKGGGIIPTDVLNDLKGGLGNLKAVPGLALGAIGNVGEVGKKVGSEIGDAGKKVGEGVGNAVKGIGGILGKKKE